MFAPLTTPVATNETRFASIELKIEKLDGRMTLVIWQLNVLIGAFVALIIKAFA